MEDMSAMHWKQGWKRIGSGEASGAGCSAETDRKTDPVPGRIKAWVHGPGWVNRSLDRVTLRVGLEQQGLVTHGLGCYTDRFGSVQGGPGSQPGLFDLKLDRNGSGQNLICIGVGPELNRIGSVRSWSGSGWSGGGTDPRDGIWKWKRMMMNTETSGGEFGRVRRRFEKRFGPLESSRREEHFGKVMKGATLDNELSESGCSDFNTVWCVGIVAERRLQWMFDSAKALAFENVPTREETISDKREEGHFGMSPAFNLYGCTLIVLAEWKPPVYDNTRGIVLVTATTRRNSPNNLDWKIHHNNLLNNILAKIEGNNAKADDALMLDIDGYVSETNATNIVVDLVVKEDLILEERRISLSEVHTADEMWTSGTMGELSPVVKVDERRIGDGEVGPVTKRLQVAYKNLTQQSGVPIPTYLEN
ncbi:hypothetical protein PIB30_063097 [Stylosanthes scabra]|uniref:Uncharacterized protein n=1 Tax=Stylosanthes scabra TaxID=79078 RepID=A0ABU6ZK17_9FABA|nr:hypothetical protein [Stylosanthes scabra]